MPSANGVEAESGMRRGWAMRPTAVLLAVLLFSSPLLIIDQGPYGHSEADSLSSWTRVFHLHDGEELSYEKYDWMNSSGPANPPYTDYDGDTYEGVSIRKSTPAERQYHAWILYPGVGSDVVLAGDLSAYVWAKSLGNESGSIVRATFYDMAPGQIGNPSLWTVIGAVDVALTGPFYSTFKLYNLTLPAVSYTLPGTHFLVLLIQRGDDINDRLLIYYDKTDYDSYIVLTSLDFISVDEVRTQDSDGNPETTFSDMEQVVVMANISNPYGAYEIVSPELSVRYSSNDTVVLSGLVMSPNATDPSTEPYWMLFKGVFLPAGNGTFVVTVEGIDPQGSPSWLEWSFTVITVDHFQVDAPSSVVAGEGFAVTVSARDYSGGLVPEWAGTVTLDAYKTDLVTLGEGSLSVTSVVFGDLDGGSVTVPDEEYSYAEEIILIRASSGPKYGWSEPIPVFSGPVETVEVSTVPSSVSTVTAGDVVSFAAVGKDSSGNINTSWTPYWSLIGSVGQLSSDGLEAEFLATTVGAGEVNCSCSETGAYAVVQLVVVAGELETIQITPPGPMTIREGEEVFLSATGYDASSNPVDISGAAWFTTTSGTVTGLGSSATYRAGFIPESGTVFVEKDGKRGTLEVFVITALNGPWLSEIPAQIGVEDAGWSLSLSTYWHYANGTESLEWFVVDVNQSLFIVTREVSSNAIVNFVPQPDMYGDDEFVLWVRDPAGYSAFQTITVSIQPVNDRPKFVNHPPSTVYVRYETPYQFDYSYYVNDVDNPKSELLMSSSLSSISFEGLKATFLFPAKDVGSYFEIAAMTLSDGMASASMNVVVWVTDDHPPALNGSLPHVTIYEGDMDVFVYDLDDYFYDIDDQYLVYAENFENIEVTIDQVTHEVYISAPTEWSGMTEGTFTAIDSQGAFKTGTVIVTVVAVNDNPSVYFPSVIFVHYDEAVYFDLDQYINDPDNPAAELSVAFTDPHVWLTSPVDFRMVLQFPANLTEPGYIGPYSVVVGVNVSDPAGGFNDTCTFSVHVSDNYPPVLKDPGKQSFYSFPEDGYLNDTLRFNDLFYDPDVDSVLNYSISSLSASSILLWTVYADGVVNLTAEPDQFGTEAIVLTATDEHDAWASWMVTVYVIPVNDAPLIAPIPDMIVKNGPRNLQYNISGYIHDVEATDFSEFVFFIEPSEYVALVGDSLFVTLPSDVDVITIRLRVSDGESESNEVEFQVGVKKSIGAIIGWPYSLPFMLLAAAVTAYFIWTRIPRPYSLENLFLIHNDGRLISHVSKEENTNLDQDVLSAMFTAVQEFVRDSFQKGEVGLKKLEIGDKSVVIEKGASAYLALIYSGHPSAEVLGSLAILLRDVEERFKGRIERWDGTMKSLKGVDKMLLKYMSAAYKPGDWQEEEELREEEWVDILTKET